MTLNLHHPEPELPAPWMSVRGTLLESDAGDAKPVCCCVAGGYIVVGVRTAAELRAIAEWVATWGGTE